ncbi:hypothetical protein DL89DRAFT_15223 [Linderina pennispora]|uniref:Uncharacterized protein n=1 Tax=Linderina pennispora TaxID=61395 RepID=A0A1Y1WM67_9FUNG|nr:uncharacterized protein DL89DRAFT_15223 [Linderina pennispora]ORX74378.1 hypothetical protein DL89DRAFT_15223 [Linderina pennispora]
MLVNHSSLPHSPCGLVRNLYCHTFFLLEDLHTWAKNCSDHPVSYIGPAGGKRACTLTSCRLSQKTSLGHMICLFGRSAPIARQKGEIMPEIRLAEEAKRTDERVYEGLPGYAFRQTSLRPCGNSRRHPLAAWEAEWELPGTRLAWRWHPRRS